MWMIKSGEWREKANYFGATVRKSLKRALTIWSFFVLANTEKFPLMGKYVFFNHWTKGDIYDKNCTFIMYLYNNVHM